MLRFIVVACWVIVPNFIFSQNGDSTKVVQLKELEINNREALGGMDRMPSLKENVIYAGKKSEVIVLNKINADLSTNNTRQVFAKVPGMSIWENDGSGIQVGVAARGLSPNRSWEFNVRQNGYDISSDVFGYPETYYSPPMEALDKIEVVRGSASLQYGPQFGGLLNYQIKKGNPNKPIAVETQQTVGSYGLFNSYNALGGTYKKLSYYTFLHGRTAKGWRQNSFYQVYTGYLSVNYQFSSNISLQAEYTKMDYESQQPGGLTDKQFEADHRQSFRARNWMGTPWNVAALTFKYNLTSALSFQIKTFATISERNSVGFTKAITVKDTINTLTKDYNNRQVDRDHYFNYGSEARISFKYNLFNQLNTIAGGVRVYQGTTKRNQLGVGNTQSNFDLSLINPLYGRSAEYGIVNYAVFAENIFHITKRWKVIPGARLEYIENKVNGAINSKQPAFEYADKRIRQILLFGVGSEFNISESTHLYANYSKAYRPVTFSELTPSATTDIIDPNLKDANGYNADIGYRGTVKEFLNFDIGYFYLLYDNRIGTLIQNGAVYRTNIGTSVSKGIESFVELDVLKLIRKNSLWGSLMIFSSNSLMDAKYIKWNTPDIANDPSLSIKGKRVENAPEFIHRLGAAYYFKGFSVSWQFSKVAAVYTDAANTETANSSGTIGKLSGYEVMDASVAYKFLQNYHVKAGVNNLTDTKYATRRSGGYPGPGILPGNGRTVFLTIGASF